MKKVLMVSALMCAMTVCVFAQSYTVQSVAGRVQQERLGIRVDLKVGDIITANTVIHTGIGASLVLREGIKTFTVPAASKGKVSELAVAFSGIRISGNVVKIDTGAVSRTSAQASTASVRASDAAEDLDIAAE